MPSTGLQGLKQGKVSNPHHRRLFDAIRGYLVGLRVRKVWGGLLVESLLKRQRELMMQQQHGLLEVLGNSQSLLQMQFWHNKTGQIGKQRF